MVRTKLTAAGYRGNHGNESRDRRTTNEHRGNDIIIHILLCQVSITYPVRFNIIQIEV